MVALNGGDPDRVAEWVQANHSVVNYGHLREANTYSWRADDVAMSTLIDHRFGEMRDQSTCGGPRSIPRRTCSPPTPPPT